MLLKDQMRECGNVLFRWRSYLPLLLLPLVIAAVSQSGSFEEWVGQVIESVWEVASLCVALLGLLVRALTVGHAPAGTSGRNTRGQRAEVLNTTGLYSVCRNPLYLGNFLVLLGFLLAIKVWWLVIIASAAFALYYERIILAEEAFLEERFGRAYTDWATETPAFFPNPRLWRRSDLPFSLRSTVRREFHGFYLIVVVFTLVELGEDTLAGGEQLSGWVQENLPWVIFFCFGSLIYLVIRMLAKHTRVLKATGR